MEQFFQSLTTEQIQEAASKTTPTEKWSFPTPEKKDDESWAK